MSQSKNSSSNPQATGKAELRSLVWTANALILGIWLLAVTQIHKTNLGFRLEVSPSAKFSFVLMIIGCATL